MTAAPSTVGPQPTQQQSPTLTHITFVTHNTQKHSLKFIPTQIRKQKTEINQEKQNRKERTKKQKVHPSKL